jgi:hypothetical protein
VVKVSIWSPDHCPALTASAYSLAYWLVYPLMECLLSLEET